jgi:hypothetical protein
MGNRASTPTRRSVTWFGFTFWLQFQVAAVDVLRMFYHELKA